MNKTASRRAAITQKKKDEQQHNFEKKVVQSKAYFKTTFLGSVLQIYRCVGQAFSKCSILSIPKGVIEYPRDLLIFYFNFDSKERAMHNIDKEIMNPAI